MTINKPNTIIMKGQMYCDIDSPISIAMPTITIMIPKIMAATGPEWDNPKHSSSQRLSRDPKHSSFELYLLSVRDGCSDAPHLAHTLASSSFLNPHLVQ